MQEKTLWHNNNMREIDYRLCKIESVFRGQT